MGFPIITPASLKELKEKLSPLTPEDFCDVAVSVAAVEYAPKLENIEVAKAILTEKESLSYSMINLPDEQSEQFVQQSQGIIKAYPSAAYYWQMRTLFISVLQNRSVSLENRMLLLNYAVKATQGMIDNGQPDRIPQFIDEFTSLSDYAPVMGYFKSIRPNPGYSLADGISLIKSLKKPNAAYKEVINTIYKNLGVSGPETLNMIDMKKYIEMRKVFSQDMAGDRAALIENVLVSYVWTYSLPLNSSSFNFWDHFVFFCSLYNAIKILYTCYMPGKEEDDFVKAISAFDSALRASDSNLMKTVIQAVRNSGQSNNGDMATLTLS